MSVDGILSFATSVAKEAGDLACELRRSPQGLLTEAKGPMDFVTHADRACENHIRARIADAFPEDSILGEESGWKDGTAGTWIVDPIDGTQNYARGTPNWAISIAYFDGSSLTHGVIHAPDLGQTAAAVAGGPAYLNGDPVQIGADSVSNMSPVISMGYSLRTPLQNYLGQVERLMSAGVDHRRHGAATIGFVGVLAGWVDAYFEASLNIWDAAAGLVLVEAANCRASHSPVAEFLHAPSAVLVQNGAIPALDDLIADRTLIQG